MFTKSLSLHVSKIFILRREEEKNAGKCARFNLDVLVSTTASEGVERPVLLSDTSASG